MTYRLTRFIGFCYKRNTNIIPDHMVMCYEFKRYETVFISLLLSTVCLLKFWRFHFQCCETRKTNKSHDWSANVNCESANWNAYQAHSASLHILCTPESTRRFSLFLPSQVEIEMGNLVKFINVQQHLLRVCVCMTRHKSIINSTQHILRLIIVFVLFIQQFKWHLLTEMTKKVCTVNI